VTKVREEPICIFLSCGTPDTPAQEAFLCALEAHLRSHGCEPQTVGRSKFSGRQPVQAARDLIGDCRGAVVIAFERTRILHGVDRPECAEPIEVRNESHPTVWNQMEASMAYAQRVPILTLVQKGLKRQGMLSTRLEWVALEADLTTAFLLTAEFRQVFDEWVHYVRQGQVTTRAELDPATLNVGYLLSQMKPGQIVGLLTSLLGLLTVVATLSFKIGQWYHAN
jgi:hypothetical protein